jgi:hypothetical protein
VSGATQLTGVRLGYDLIPELRGEFLLIGDWSGGSAVLFPSLTWAASGSLEIFLGVQVGVGPHDSEYGGRGTLGYVLAEWFF